MTLAIENLVGLTGPRYGMPPARVRRFTVDEYHKLIDDGVFSSNERFELLEGWIVEKMSRNPIHDATVQLADRMFQGLLPAEWSVRTQLAMTTPDSEPEPDIAIVRGDARTYIAHHPYPQDVAVVIEVANSSLEEDRTLKGRIYARAGVREYWIINLIESKLEQYQDPSESGYRSRKDYTAGQSIGLGIGERSVDIAVRDLLP